MSEKWIFRIHTHCFCYFIFFSRVNGLCIYDIRSEPQAISGFCYRYIQNQINKRVNQVLLRKHYFAAIKLNCKTILVFIFQQLLIVNEQKIETTAKKTFNYFRTKRKFIVYYCKINPFAIITFITLSLLNLFVRTIRCKISKHF